MSPEARATEAMDAGDYRAALACLMEAYGDDLYRYCRHVVCEPALAADVHQTVFVQAYRDLPRFQSRSTLRTWLYSIARHRCLDAMKARNRWRRRFIGVAELPERGDSGPSAESHLLRDADSRMLEQALSILKPRVRAAVLLRYVEGMSYTEMAEVCGERAATLQARVSRALPVLRRALEGHRE